MSERIAILLSCFKRPEYTAKCIEALEFFQHFPNADFYLVDDGSNDGTDEILTKAKLNSFVTVRKENLGLRLTIIDFFEKVNLGEYKYIAKMDNDCLAPYNWLKDSIDILNSNDVDILSPNVMPSNAAYTYGIKDESLPYMPSKIVGGLWIMRASLIKDIYFEKMDVKGIRGAFHLLNQIIIEKEPKVGWLPNVIVQDIGHWSGQHPDHIKSADHQAYSNYVGRTVAWNAQ